MTATESHQTITPYRYDTSDVVFRRAVRVIPGGIYGHQGPSEGCYIPRSAFPLYSLRAEGTRFWDVDGNEFIDYMCGYGPNVLGYGDRDVAEAAQAQAALTDV
ncbi:aminotransferase class III-fold pyridoxal phosphate-dependent enzyme [Nocardia takedensis]|uniref:aminotransferase class III-fold pyridoxal phosphate-dependent enzyme n=1 Tax=Nocardia takedensis TaxID=259390 RepID=UPI0002DC21D6|nr:aminotransferase class III-fold pyridoxal phosphate-dependent enzyme [Nocardia takedensis]